MKHIPNFKYVECQTAITKLVEDFENKNPNKKIKAAKCNDPVTWFKKCVWVDKGWSKADPKNPSLDIFGYTKYKQQCVTKEKE